MDSSSNESFLWTDASNDSGDNKRQISSALMEDQYEGEVTSDNDYKQTACVTSLGLYNENKTKQKKKKKKKRKCSDATPESSESEKRQIKLEPESDIDVGKKRKLGKEIKVYNDSAQDCSLFNEEYLNLRVKQEQSSFVQTKKKKKHKRSNSHIDNVCESDSTMEQYITSDLEGRVKLEQVAKVERQFLKSEEKKKRKRSVVSSNIDIANETKTVVNFSGADEQCPSSSLAIDEQIEYSVIDDKFTAEETVVNKPRNMKHKTIATIKNNSEGEKKSYVQKNTRVTSEIDSDNINNNNMSLESNDFTCNNIVSSTIINSSAIDLTDKQKNKTEELRISRNVHWSKISDRIRFEDDNSSQESPFGKTPSKIKTFLKVNPQIIKIYTSDTPNESIITKDDEICTVHWPHGIDSEKFINATISSEGRGKIKIDGQIYDGVLNEDVIAITLLTHEQGQTYLKILPVKDCMNYHKRIPKVHIPDDNVMVNNQTNFTPLPEIKCRHPLFGTHYKKAIKISKVVAERLQVAKGSEAPREIKDKKKPKKSKYNSVDIKTEDSVCVKSECESLKKKKKRKHSLDNDVLSKPTKPKRVKHNADSPAVWESEKAIEENLFDF